MHSATADAQPKIFPGLVSSDALPRMAREIELAVVFAEICYKAYMRNVGGAEQEPWTTSMRKHRVKLLAEKQWCGSECSFKQPHSLHSKS